MPVVCFYFVSVSLLRQQMAKFQHHTIDLETASLPVATQVSCLGVVFDSELTFSKHCLIRGSTLLLSYEADSCSQEVIDH